MTGISKSTLSRLESGQRRPTLELLLALSQPYRVPLDELVGAPEVGDPPRPAQAGSCQGQNRVASGFNGYLVGMAVAGLGFGVYMAVDLALVVDVLPAGGSDAKNLGVFNIAAALPFSVGPAVTSGVLAITNDSYAVQVPGTQPASRRRPPSATG